MPHVLVKRDPTPTTDHAYNRMLARYRMDAVVPDYLIVYDLEWTHDEWHAMHAAVYWRERRGHRFGESDWGEGDPYYERIG